MFIVASTAFLLAPFSSHIDSIEQLPTTDSQKTHVFFVRHGESAYNVVSECDVQLISGKGLEIPLTSKGHKQAAHVGRKLAEKLPTGHEDRKNVV